MAERLTRAAVSLGANLGDRAAALWHAIEALAQQPGLAVVGVSPFYETEPVGGPDQPDFLNVVVTLDLGGQHDAETWAWRLLTAARQLERDLNRVRGVRWGPRTLDVDVLAVGGLVLTDPELTVPHPRVQERGFVLIPWADIDPEFVVPGRGTVAELANALDPGERAGVRLHGGV